ncbi:MAG TPA: pyridoxal phosphate-dependent aminotransferase [Phycisphaerales bacterium]|nr:pyridoxal phosphate-dependent aminotransferase [Phycisphaerales bacterium]
MVAGLREASARDVDRARSSDSDACMIQISQRVTGLKPSATIGVDARVKALRASGVEVISFGAGEPDFDTPANIRDAAIEGLNTGKTHYTLVEGEPAARKAIAEKLKRENGIACGPEHIVISAGAKHSLYLALQCLLDPGKGQEVIVPTPAWVSYRPMVELAGGSVVELGTKIEDAFKVTAAQVERAISAKTAAIILNSPSNPTGMVYSKRELTAIADVLAKHEHVVIVTDEIYEKLIFSGEKAFSIGSIRELAERTVTVNGMSKAFAMTGWRLGYACATGNGGGFAKAMTKLQGQMTSNVTSFCYPAIVEALSERSAEAVETMRKQFAKRAELIFGIVSGWKDVKCAKPMGAFYVFPDVSAHFGKVTPGGRKVESAKSFAEALLEEEKVAVVPGEDFGKCAEGCVRLSFACSEKNIEEGCGRIGKFVAGLK